MVKRNRTRGYGLLASLETSGNEVSEAFVIVGKGIFWGSLTHAGLLSKVQKNLEGSDSGRHLWRHFYNKILSYIFPRAISWRERGALFFTFYNAFYNVSRATVHRYRPHHEFPATKSDPIQLARCSITTGINQAANVSVCTA